MPVAIALLDGWLLGGDAGLSGHHACANYFDAISSGIHASGGEGGRAVAPALPDSDGALRWLNGS